MCGIKLDYDESLINIKKPEDFDTNNHDWTSSATT